MDFTYLFTNFSGRINRTPYWLGILVLVVTTLVVGTALMMSLIGSDFFLIVMVAFILLIYAAAIPLTVKRLHDRGKSGHYAWLIYGSSIVGSAVDPATRAGDQMSTPALIVTLITIATGLWFFIELGFFRGTLGPNPYGPDPLEAK